MIAQRDAALIEAEGQRQAVDAWVNQVGKLHRERDAWCERWHESVEKRVVLAALCSTQADAIEHTFDFMWEPGKNAAVVAALKGIAEDLRAAVGSTETPQ